MELYNNYWKLIKEEIPSKGMFYDDEAIIKIRPLNVQEVKYLSTLNEQNATDVINEIIEKCTIFKNMKFEDLLLADREYLIFWLRANSFQQNNGYDLNLVCDVCDEKYQQKVHLAEFPVELYTENKKERLILLPDCGLKFKLKHPTIKDLKRTNPDPEIESFMRYIDLGATNEQLETLLSNLSAMDYNILKNNIDEMFIGFSRNIQSVCPKCGALKYYNIEITDNGLFGVVNIGEVLETILRICKYTNYQIPESAPWWEVETQQMIVNKMIEEEKAEMDRQDVKTTINRSDLDKF
jgi:hypothetical protein